MSSPKRLRYVHNSIMNAKINSKDSVENIKNLVNFFI